MHTDSSISTHTALTSVHPCRYDREGDDSRFALTVNGKRIGVLSRDDAMTLNAYRCVVRRCDELLALDADREPDGDRYTHREKVYTESVFEKRAEDLTKNLAILIRQAQIDCSPT